MAIISSTKQKLIIADAADSVGLTEVGDLLRTMSGSVQTPPTLEAAIAKAVTNEKMPARKAQFLEALKILRTVG